MSIGVENKTFKAELFKQRQLRTFVASEDQLLIAKESLILKKKCNTNVHSLLFCKSFSDSLSNFYSQNQKKILEDQKSKYFDYIRKTFKQKIPQDFESENKLKRALKNKIKQHKQKQNKDEGQVTIKRTKIQIQDLRKSSKKVKIQKKDTKVKPSQNKKDKQKKQIIEEQPEQLDQQQSNNFQSEIDLHNDELDEQFDADQNDE